MNYETYFQESPSRGTVAAEFQALRSRNLLKRGVPLDYTVSTARIVAVVVVTPSRDG